MEKEVCLVKPRFKLWIAAAIVLLLLMSGLSQFVDAASDAKPIESSISVYYTPLNYVFDGTQLAPPEGQRGFVYADRTYVPLRFIANALNKSVNWDNATATVTVSDPSLQEQNTIAILNKSLAVKNSTLAKAAPASSKGPQSGTLQSVFTPSETPHPASLHLAASTLSVSISKINFSFDGQSKQPPADMQGLIYQGRLFVPIRFVAEAIGKKIDWDPTTSSIRSHAGNVKTDSSTAAPADNNSPQPTPTPTAPIAPTPTPADSNADSTATDGSSPNTSSTGVGLPPSIGNIPPSGSGLTPPASNGSNTVTVPVPPTYDALKSTADQQITALQSDAENALIPLYLQYRDSTTLSTTKISIQTQVSSMMFGYDSQFAAILNSFKIQLLANGYDISIITTYQQDYNNQKQQALTAFGL